jgi:hypothetical protein
MVDVGHHQILNSTGQQVDSASHQSINPCFLGSPSFLALKQIGSGPCKNCWRSWRGNTGTITITSQTKGSPLVGIRHGTDPFPSFDTSIICECLWFSILQLHFLDNYYHVIKFYKIFTLLMNCFCVCPLISSVCFWNYGAWPSWYSDGILVTKTSILPTRPT